MKVDNIFGIEPEVHTRENEEAAHQKASASQQYEVQRTFADLVAKRLPMKSVNTTR